MHNPLLTDGPTWDCAAVSLRAIDQNGNLLPYCGEAVQLRTEGPVKILGPSVAPVSYTHLFHPLYPTDTHLL